MALPAWVPDTETKPAPMPLLLVQSFVNTWEADAGTDLLGDRRSQAGGCTTRGCSTSPPPMSPTSPRCARGPGGHPRHARPQRRRPCPRALRCWRRSACSQMGADSCPSCGLPGRSRCGPTTGRGRRGWPRLLLIIRDAQGDGTWDRLKACRNPECRWAYYDRSHAGRGAWCDMAVCGNRIKNRNLRSRRSRRGAEGGHDGRAGPHLMAATVRVTVEDKVGTLALDNDTKRNALGVGRSRSCCGRWTSSSAKGCERWCSGLRSPVDGVVRRPRHRRAPGPRRGPAPVRRSARGAAARRSAATREGSSPWCTGRSGAARATSS